MPKAEPSKQFTSGQPARDLLNTLIEAAIATAQPVNCVAPHLPDPPPGGRIVIVGSGKAAWGMAAAAVDHYRESDVLHQVAGAVATRHGYARPLDHLDIVEAGHPVPDDSSIVAAAQARELVARAQPVDLILVLLSGGASAIWSQPVAGLTLSDKQRLTRDLLRGGATIHEINCVRKHLSAIKGGKLIATARAPSLTLAISDVPGDDPATIGSGPTVGDPTTLAQARRIVARYGIDVSGAVVKALDDPANETPKPGDTCFDGHAYRIVAAPAAALRQIAHLAGQAGYQPFILGDALEGEARAVARDHAALAHEFAAQGRRAAIISGGELTVTVRGAGDGGPNQEYALALACALEGRPGIWAAAADTDGTDGGSGAIDDPAGAIVTPDTLARAKGASCNAAIFLSENNSTGFFRAIGDLIVRGPSGTNINDVRIILTGVDG